MRRHRWFFGLLAAEGIVILLLHAFAGDRSFRSGPSGAALGAVTRTLAITDLAVWTEARYTRHPSQADFFSPFQDFPAAAEHFPAGSIVPPPPRINGGRGR